MAVWLALGALVGRPWRDRYDGEARGSPAVLVVGAVAAIGATVFTYRRLARPVSDLLEGAERVGGGDYDIRVDPAGPRSVRTLGRAFNDMANRLEASETARQRFLADVTHELRTPLTVLRGELELQLDGIHDRSDGSLRLLLDQTGTLERLVEDLRVLSLGDAGELVLHRESVRLEVLVESVTTALAATAARRSVRLAVETSTGCEIEADPLRLAQVLTNVLTNAVRHSPPGGTVTVELAQAIDGAGVVTVIDEGPGLGADPERVFDRFARAADSGGSGLGLTIARQLVTAHGGTISAENGPAGGARFTIRLPVGS
ncbi:MAG: sensor histidine kinase [Desertimonas sp.]